jgi:hypothetical protein
MSPFVVECSRRGAGKARDVQFGEGVVVKVVGEPVIIAVGICPEANRPIVVVDAEKPLGGA